MLHKLNFPPFIHSEKAPKMMVWFVKKILLRRYVIKFGEKCSLHATTNNSPRTSCCVARVVIFYWTKKSGHPWFKTLLLYSFWNFQFKMQQVGKPFATSLFSRCGNKNRIFHHFARFCDTRVIVDLLSHLHSSWRQSQQVGLDL